MCSWRFTYIETADDEKIPDVPYFMLGHSMGSSLLRQYIQMYGNGLSGAIIMGTMSEQNKTELKAWKRSVQDTGSFKRMALSKQAGRQDGEWTFL